MKVLVIDTALDACTVALADDGVVRVERRAVMARGHQEAIGPMVQAVADAVGGIGDLQRIGVTVGPGSFTGLRVGVAMALGLGSVLDTPVVGLSTLDALAETARVDRAGGPLMAVIDARRGQVYGRRYLDGRAMEPPAALTLAEAIRRAAGPGGPYRLVGSGAAVMQDAASGPDAVGPAASDPVTASGEPGSAATPSMAAPSAAALARLTVAADPALHPARPLYLRPPDAQPSTRLPGQARR